MRFGKLAARFIGAGALALAGAVWENSRFGLNEISLPILQAGSTPIKVLHISDIHLLPGQKSKRAWLRDLASQPVDLVVNTGDNIASDGGVEALLTDLGALLNIPGFFVFGSNDYFAPKPKNPFSYLFRTSPVSPKPVRKLNFEKLRAAFVESGWVDLNNQSGKVVLANHDGFCVEGRGVDDPHLGYDSYQPSGVSDADLLIGVAHAPYLNVLDQMRTDQVQLIFAGHTHGGQLCLPGGRAIVTNCDLPTSQAKGLSFHLGNGENSQPVWLHVSGGLGSSPYVPVRTFNRPEATLLTLTS